MRHRRNPSGDGGLVLVRELDERLGLTGWIQKHLMDSCTGRNTQFRWADLSWQSVYSWLPCGTEGVERAFSGTTESAPEESFCWNDSTRGQVVSTHTKLGDHHGGPGFSALDPWSRIFEDGRLKIGKKSARYRIGKL
jgi:hypothetical protein